MELFQGRLFQLLFWKMNWEMYLIGKITKKHLGFSACILQSNLKYLQFPIRLDYKLKTLKNQIIPNKVEY